MAYLSMMFTSADIEKYLFKTREWVSFRDPVYPVNSWPPLIWELRFGTTFRDNRSII
jgi:hypothetical protein